MTPEANAIHPKRASPRPHKLLTIICAFIPVTPSPQICGRSNPCEMDGCCTSHYEYPRAYLRACACAR
eukprot:6950803-Alexandrium_andersonii.AAC.1